MVLRDLSRERLLYIGSLYQDAPNLIWTAAPVHSEAAQVRVQFVVPVADYSQETPQSHGVLEMLLILLLETKALLTMKPVSGNRMSCVKAKPDDG